MSELYYRYQETQYIAGLDQFDEPVPGAGPMALNLYSYPVVRHTPKGVIIDVYGEEKFISHTWRKRYAAPSPEEALSDYVARKSRQVGILKARAAQAERALLLGRCAQEEPEPPRRLYKQAYELSGFMRASKPITGVKA